MGHFWSFMTDRSNQCPNGYISLFHPHLWHLCYTQLGLTRTLVKYYFLVNQLNQRGYKNLRQLLPKMPVVVTIQGSLFVSRMMTVVTSLTQQQRNVAEFLVDSLEAKRFGLTPPSLLPTTNP